MLLPLGEPQVPSLLKAPQKTISATVCLPRTTHLLARLAGGRPDVAGLSGGAKHNN